MRNLVPSDLSHLERILYDTGAFNDDEVACAMELLAIVLDDPSQKDYLVSVAESDGKVSGYVLYGPTPLTVGNVTLYWIAVDPRGQGKGIGKCLMERVESYAKQHRGRLIYLETSSRGSYTRTRTFYERAGYAEESRLEDFYSPGDDRLCFVKRLESSTQP